MNNLKEFYNRNEDFRKYVNSYAKKYNEGKSISVDEALENEIVKSVAAQYREKEETRIK